MRVRTLRQKREAIHIAANKDAWALQGAEQSELAVVDSDAEPLAVAWPKVAPAGSIDQKLREHLRIRDKCSRHGF
jgi:hypothetical protein